MTVSGTISTTNFDNRTVIDRSFNACGIDSQRITAEMQQIALDFLYLILSEIASVKTPSWCIERLIFPFYANQPVITMPLGTEEILNCNYRYLQQATGTNTNTSTSRTIRFETATIVNSVGILWAANSVPVVFEVSTNGTVWVQVGSTDVEATTGQWVWTDIAVGDPFLYFRIRATSGVLVTADIYTGNRPNEVPMGLLNRDSYVAQNNKVFGGRPTTYWFQRERDNPVIHLWPAPNAQAEFAQLIVWRHRQIMDVGTLLQSLDVPQRWFYAIVMKLAAKLAISVSIVDPQRIPLLSQESENAMNIAWMGDNDRSSLTIVPYMSYYTA